MVKLCSNGVVDTYTAAKLLKSGKSFVIDRVSKIKNIKRAQPSVFWENILVMQSRFGIHNINIKKVKKALVVWNKLDTDEKAEIANIAYQLILSSDLDRKLAEKMSEINNTLLMTAADDGTYSLSGYAKKFFNKLNKGEVFESDESGDSMTSGSIADNPQKMFGNKIIKRKIKKFKAIKFKDPRKVNQVNTENSKHEEE